MKVEKTFWVEYESFKQFKKALNNGGRVDLKISTTPDSGNDYMETLTIAYEMDREITIKESDIDRLLSDRSMGFFEKDIELIKKAIFGEK